MSQVAPIRSGVQLGLFKLALEQELDEGVEITDVSMEIVELTPPSIPPPAAPTPAAPDTAVGALDLGDSNIEQDGTASGGLSSGAVVGIVFGVLAALGLVVGGYYLMILKKRNDNVNKIILQSTHSTASVEEIGVDVGADK